MDSGDDDEGHFDREAASSEIPDRVRLLERDTRAHARSLTEIVNKLQGVGDGFSPKQIEQLQEVVNRAVQRAMGDIGFDMDDDQKSETRETVSFIFRLKRTWDGAVNKTGSAVLTAFLVTLFGIIGLGFWAWISSNIHK